MPTITDALQAYRAAAGSLGAGPAAPDAAEAPGESFSALVKNVLSGAVEAGKKSERLSAQALAGKADLVDVVTAVNAAQSTLQTVVAVRDKVVSAYQTIMQMPL